MQSLAFLVTFCEMCNDLFFCLIPDPAKRMYGAYGYIGYLGVIFLSIWIALQLLGVF